MAQDSITVKLTEIDNGRPFTKRFVKGTRAQRVAFEKAVIAATAGNLVDARESIPLVAGDTGAPITAGTYSDATLYFTKGVLNDSYDFEQLTNSVSDGAGGVNIADPLMTAIEAAFVGSDGLTGWTLTQGIYHR